MSKIVTSLVSLNYMLYIIAITLRRCRSIKSIQYKIDKDVNQYKKKTNNIEVKKPILNYTRTIYFIVLLNVHVPRYIVIFA